MRFYWEIAFDNIHLHTLQFKKQKIELKWLKSHCAKTKQNKTANKCNIWCNVFCRDGKSVIVSLTGMQQYNQVNVPIFIVLCKYVGAKEWEIYSKICHSAYVRQNSCIRSKSFACFLARFEVVRVQKIIQCSF